MELDFATSGARFMLDLKAIDRAMTGGLGCEAATLIIDMPCLALELVPVLPERFIAIIATPDHGSRTDWKISTFAPAATYVVPIL